VIVCGRFGGCGRADLRMRVLGHVTGGARQRAGRDRPGWRDAALEEAILQQADSDPCQRGRLNVRMNRWSVARLAVLIRLLDVTPVGSKPFKDGKGRRRYS